MGNRPTIAPFQAEFLPIRINRMIRHAPSPDMQILGEQVMRVRFLGIILSLPTLCYHLD